MSCLLWTGAKSDGYGVREIEGKRYYVHRLAYCEAHELQIEDISRQVVCHTCDVRNCYSSDHLFLGTRDDNNKDAARKGRICQGGNHPCAKLSTEEVVQVRKLYATGLYLQKTLALQFGVSAPTVSEILNHKTRRLR